MNRLYPAETRLKEGAKRTRLRPDRWECSLAAGWWRPVSALPPVSRDCRFDVKRAEVGAVSLEAKQLEDVSASSRIFRATPARRSDISGCRIRRWHSATSRSGPWKISR